MFSPPFHFPNIRGSVHGLRFTCVTGRPGCPCKSSFCPFVSLIFINCYLYICLSICVIICNIIFLKSLVLFPSCVCSLLCCMSICVVVVEAHKVELGPRACPRLNLVRGCQSSVKSGPRECPRLMVASTQTLFVWTVWFFSWWIIRVSSSIAGCWTCLIITWVSLVGVRYNPIDLLVWLIYLQL